jgi:hypothetical protein
LPGYVAAGETSQGGVNSVCKKKSLKEGRGRGGHQGELHKEEVLGLRIV